MDRNQQALSPFHPLIGEWFGKRRGAPTDVQAQAWPIIAAGKHALITAPTGSGKTLTAFLWALNQLITGVWGRGQTRVLYVSPLKALNNDIRRNLTAPLAELQGLFQRAGKPFPEIGVLTRSGDTPAEERRRMFRRPPEILITTPESLNLLLNSRTGRQMLTGVATVILDEIHALVATKRGTHLITAVERLTLLAGEFQRIALSATVRPLSTVAEFVGGFLPKGDSGDDRYARRPVEIVSAREEKRSEIRVAFPPAARERLVDASWWPVLAEAFRKIIEQNRATLLFANSRRTAEKVTRLINEKAPAVLAYAHHGSLSREIRLTVEERLKNGELKAIVATSSLELGIDIGELDEVILIQTPPAISAAIQRIGRSGHGVGGTSRGLLFPTHGHDFLYAAVLARCAADRKIEAAAPIEGPLDVLAQVILAMTGVESWDIDALYSFLRTCHPYHGLPRRQFDLVLAMLAGRYADTRLRELKPRLFIDRIDNTVQAREGTLRLVALAGGTIPDRGYYDLRIEESRAKIGELDEEFVWERRIGDTFTLGTQVWRIKKVTHNDVEVVPVEAQPGIFPFWRAEEQNRDFHFSERILLFLEKFNARLADPSLKEELRRDYFLDETAADELIGHLTRQRSATGTDLPHRRHLLIEHFDDPLNDADRKQVVLHTFWGGRVNRPFALALQAAWEEKYGLHLETFVNNDAILLMLPHAFSAAELFSLVTAESLERQLRRILETSGFFGARFRENAGRALLLPKGDFQRRLPLWLNRLRAKKLLDAVLPYADFPILLETWRDCLKDEFDLDHLKELLDEIRDGKIRIGETTTAAASPFCDGLIWKQTNTHMYEGDSPAAGKTSRLGQDLIREAVLSGRLRPKIPKALVAQLLARLQRTAPGYAPRSAAELLDWLRERLFIPLSEWQALCAAIDGDGEIVAAEALTEIGLKIAAVRLPGAKTDGICAVENFARIAGVFGTPGEAFPAHDLISGEPIAWIPASAGMTKGATGTTDGVTGTTKGVEETPKGAAGAIRGVTGRTKGAVGLTKGVVGDLEWVTGNLQRATGDLDDTVSEEEGEAPDLAGFLRRWLSYYGPLPQSALPEILGLPVSRLAATLADLAEAQVLLLDLLTDEAAEIEVCDRENLEILLRMARRARQPVFSALPAAALPLFLAAWQGLTAPGDSPDALRTRIEQLFGFPAPAEAWEKHLLPARLSPYYGAWLDTLLATSDLAWFGCGLRRISFAFADDRELFLPEEGGNRDPLQSDGKPVPDALATLLPQRFGRYSLFDIARHAGLDSAAVTEKLWNLVWQGQVANDAFATLRQGIMTDFAPFSPKPERGRIPRSGYNRWAASRPLSGNWHAIGPGHIDRDPIEEAELAKDRVRQLLARYGILFRELLAYELPPLQWTGVFRALRLMELSGEILSGHFFAGIPGAQFISPEAFRFLNDPLPEEAVYWLNATDPASLCGIRNEALKAGLPSRIPSTHLVYCGRKLALLSRRNGGVLEFFVPPDDPRLAEYLSFMKALLGREFLPEKTLLVETINGQSARESEYSEALKAFGFRSYYKGLELTRKY
ncbi:MAG: DEAD/DEAH box helicase [Deltaproteobacteria bacterium]|nr:DEAD/DEAH box helicase [Deltaproteobacteria bacterium]